MKLFISLAIVAVSVVAVTAADRSPAAQAAFDEGLHAAKTAKYQDARKLFDQAIAADPEFADAYRERGWIHGVLGTLDSAFTDLARAIKLAPKDARNYWTRAWVRINWEKDNTKAVEDLTSAIELDPKTAQFFNDRGFAKASLHKFEEAIVDFTEAIRLDSKFGRSHQNRAESFYCLGRYEEALKDFDRAHELIKQPSARLYYTTGECLFKLKDYRRTIAMMTKSIGGAPKGTPRPNDLDSENYVGDCHLLLAEYKEALASYDRALKHDPEEGASHYRRGLALQELQRESEAKTAFARATALGFKP